MIGYWPFREDSNKYAVFNQTVASFLCCLTSMATGLAIGWSSSAFHKIQNQETGFMLDPFQQSWVVSSLNIGVIFGTIPSSFLMDKIGRKNTLLFSSVLSLLHWFLVATTNTAEMLYVARFLGGLWTGITTSVTPVYLAEILQPFIRGTLGALFSVMLYAGVLSIDLIGPFVSYMNLSVFCGSITAIFILTFPFVPETPYLLMIKNKPTEATAALSWFRGNQNVEDELKIIEDYVEKEKKNVGGWKDVFLSEESRTPLISCLILSFVQKFSGFFTVISYQTVILPEMVGPLTSETATLIIGVVLLLSVIMSSLLMDKLGRIPLLNLSYYGIILSMLPTGTWFFLARPGGSISLQEYSFMPFLGFVVFIIAFSTGLGPVTNIYPGEVLPLFVKAKAMSLVVSCAALFTIVNTELFAYINTYIGMYANYFSFAAIAFLGFFFTRRFVVETKGKTLQAIQEEFRGQPGSPTMKGDYFVL